MQYTTSLNRLIIINDKIGEILYGIKIQVHRSNWYSQSEFTTFKIEGRNGCTNKPNKREKGITWKSRASAVVVIAGGLRCVILFSNKHARTHKVCLLPSHQNNTFYFALRFLYDVLCFMHTRIIESFSSILVVQEIWRWTAIPLKPDSKSLGSVRY